MHSVTWGIRVREIVEGSCHASAMEYNLCLASWALLHNVSPCTYWVDATLQLNCHHRNTNAIFNRCTCTLRLSFLVVSMACCWNPYSHGQIWWALTPETISWHKQSSHPINHLMCHSSGTFYWQLLWLPLTELYSIEAYFPAVNFKKRYGHAHTVNIILDHNHTADLH